MQTITITGYLSKDAESATTRDGTAVTRWNVPVKQFSGGVESTNWYRVSVWGKRADFAAKLRKGEFVAVAGELTIGEYDGKPQYEIRANDFQTVRPAPRDGDARRAPDGSQGHAGAFDSGKQGGFADDLDGDSVPFATRNSIW